MNWLHFVLFFVSSILQVSLVEAKFELITPSEEPVGCSKAPVESCRVSTGDRPRRVEWKNLNIEIAKDSLVTIKQDGEIVLHKGTFVVQSPEKIMITSLFAAVSTPMGKIMLSADSEKLEVFALEGAEVNVKPVSASENQSLVPGYKNWYSSQILGDYSYGIPQAIDLNQFAKIRSGFFLDYRLGFHKELEIVASHIKSATAHLSQAYRTQIERKLAAIEEDKRQIKAKENQRRVYDLKMRDLFLKRISHQD